MRVINCQQNTPQWLRIRAGRLTASRMKDVMAKRKKGEGELACRRDYKFELVCERLTGRAAEHYVSPAMDRGSELEPYAIAAYEVGTGDAVDRVGFVLHPTMDFAGASPDALINDDGGLEVKAPNTSTHLQWMIDGVVPLEHQDQLMWNIACTERKYWVFMSFDDRLPKGLRVFSCRMERDEKRIAEMEYAAMEFNAEVEAKCRQLLTSYSWVPQLPAPPRSTETERIGELDVPADLMAMLGDEDFRA